MESQVPVHPLRVECLERISAEGRTRRTDVISFHLCGISKVSFNCVTVHKEAHRPTHATGQFYSSKYSRSTPVVIVVILSSPRTSSRDTADGGGTSVGRGAYECRPCVGGSRVSTGGRYSRPLRRGWYECRSASQRS